MRLLLVEDDRALGQGIRVALGAEGYTLDWLQDGVAALHALRTENFDLLLLDLGLPRLDGLDLLQQLRAEQHDVPVLILTARDGWRERVEGIDAGADDYLVKPFRMEELVARLRAILRRTAGHASPVLRAGAVELDTRTRAVSVAGRETDLTALEYRLLAFLLHRQGQVVAAGELLDHLHGSDSDREANALEALLTRLRRKLGPGIIETRRGHGYLVPSDPP